MLKIHDDMIKVTNELIQQTHVRHEKQIQRLKKDIKKKDKINLIMQHVIMELLRSCWNIVYVLNNKFDEMLSIFGTLFDHLKAQAPTSEAYNALSKKINMSF